MELWQLRTFDTVAKTLNFTRASEELNLSQPAVSHQIKSLEEEIGESLFVRSKDGVSLTAAGQTMCEHANKILNMADEMRLEIEEQKDVLKGKMTMGAATMGLGSPFAIIYEGFHKIYGDIEVVFQSEYRREDVIKKVREGVLDIGIVSEGVNLTGLVIMPYYSCEFVLVVGKNHSLAKKKQVSIDDLTNQKWVMPEPPNKIRMATDESFAKAGIRPKEIFETNDGATIRTMVINSSRAAFLPGFGIYEELMDGRLVEIQVEDLECKVQLNLIWRKGRRPKPMSVMLSYLLDKRVQTSVSLCQRHTE